jgi:hypothetical protein
VERFILRFKGNGDSPVDDLERIRTLPDLKVVDDSSRMLLVEAPQEVVTKLVETLPEWSLSRERFVPMPDVRVRVRGS